MLPFSFSRFLESEGGVCTNEDVYTLSIQICAGACCVIDIPSSVEVVYFRRPDIATPGCSRRAVDYFLGGSFETVEGCRAGDGYVGPGCG